MSKNTERSLKYLRDKDYVCDMVERFIAFPKPHGHRKDYLGIIDIIAYDQFVTIGVQSCGQDFAAHKTKILESEHTFSWIKSPDRELWLIGWRKLKLKKGGKAMRWKPRIGSFTQEFGKIRFHEWAKK